MVVQCCFTSTETVRDHSGLGPQDVHLFFHVPPELWMVMMTSAYSLIIQQVLISRVQELCGSRGGRPGLPVLKSLTVSVDVKQH